MDAQLSLLMANQALIKSGDFVFDPFVGTGSLLVSAAKFGGCVLGADIDFMMLHARARPSRITQKVRDKDESIIANLKQYNCANRYMDVVVADFSNPIWSDRIKFDSIITDRNYNICYKYVKNRISYIIYFVHYKSTLWYKRIYRKNREKGSFQGSST